MHLLADLIAIPLDVVHEICEMVCGPTCHLVLELVSRAAKRKAYVPY